MWDEFLPISMPMTAIAALELSRHGVLLVFVYPFPALGTGGAGARPDHSISGRSVGGRPMSAQAISRPQLKSLK